MQIAILYISKYGTTKKVAEKISEYLKNDDVDIIDINSEKSADISGYDKIILGAGVYAGKISRKMKDFASKNYELMKSKSLYLFISGMETDKEKLSEELNNAYPGEVADIAEYKACLGGEFIFEKMNFFEKAIIKKISGVNKSISRIDEKAIKEFSDKVKS